jgi:hypothetical protein
MRTDKLHSQGYDHQVVLYAFDLIELDDDDMASPGDASAASRGYRPLTHPCGNEA